jgi:HPt (histidine-containing phosphotransfer) domain-containing protein
LSEEGKGNSVEKYIKNEDIEINGIDINKGISMTGGRLDIYLRTLAVLYKDGREKIEEISKCIKRGDLPLYTTHIHALKSASASIGASEISEKAKSLEQAGKNGDMPFIENNNNRFLVGLEILLNNIKNAISNSAAPENNISSEKLSYDIIKENLVSLKKALNDMDTITADKMLFFILFCFL